MMAVVKIYGAETSRYEYFKYNLEQFLKRFDLELEIEEIKDINRIIEDNVMSIPTLRINDHVDIVYDNDAGIDRFILESKESILHEFAPDLLSKILIPIDFSDASLNAFDYGLAFSKTVGSDIQLLHVDHPSPMVVDGMVILDKITSENQKYNLQRIVDENSKNVSLKDDEQFVTLSYLHLQGFAADEIIRLSKEKDLIVMGTTGEGKVAKKILGSVSLKVSGKAHCPVIFVPEGQKFKGFNKIVYAYSPTNYDQKVIKDIGSLARKFGSEVHLVHVDDGTPYEQFDIESYLSHMFSDIDFKVKEIYSESVEFGIANYAADNDADLIIVSKKKRGLLSRILDKKHTANTILNSPIPVMVFHNDDHGCLCGGACRKKPEEACNH